MPDPGRWVRVGFGICFLFTGPAADEAEGVLFGEVGGFGSVSPPKVTRIESSRILFTILCPSELGHVGA